ncbi:RecT family recombinase [Caballeronia zhejiangensis]|uniref:RecT family recombinase n=1 Tax=Caballeronia zhejiangensis TaxID=871203 RepID=UPI0015888BF3|nr:RecT family recombinase [Caballeronia zhejiangensis]MCG7403048.1 recombinase RecT [Caballeronia zhejiangensis]MCI1043873.1 recombinase RecT [Caballeronia zhejiangensis]
MTSDIATIETPKVFGLTPDLFSLLERVAAMMASATVMVPEHCRNKPGNCFAIAARAHGWGLDPFALAPKTHLVGTTLGYEAQVIGAAINNSGLLRDRLNFEWFGDWSKVLGRFETKASKTKKNEHGEAQTYRVPAWTPEDENDLGVRVWATLKGEDEPRSLEVLLTQARVRNSTLWADDPRQQLAYLAEKRWGRLYTPEVILGAYTRDELETIDMGERDMGRAEEVQRPRANDPGASIKAKLHRVTVKEVLKAIDDATSAAELIEAGELAKKLTNEKDKEQARQHYDAKRKSGKATQGEASREQSAPPKYDKGDAIAVNFAEVASSMESALRRRDRDALAAAADLIAQVGDEQQQVELRTMFEGFMNDLDDDSAGEVAA